MEPDIKQGFLMQAIYCFKHNQFEYILKHWTFYISSSNIKFITYGRRWNYRVRTCLKTGGQRWRGIGNVPDKAFEVLTGMVMESSVFWDITRVVC
jgi:hypothetical protein